MTVLEEVATYLGLSLEEAHKRAATGKQRLADEWASAHPTSPSAMASFYTHSQEQIWDAAAWHDTPEYQERLALVRQVAMAKKPKRVLDFGCGIGTMLLAVAEAAPDAELWGVEPNAVNIAFAVHRFQRQMPKALLHGVSSLPAGSQSFDLIICNDVLEHLPNAPQVLDQLLDLLAPGGWFIGCIAIWATDTPLHLPELRVWIPEQQIIRRNLMAAASIGVDTPIPFIVWTPYNGQSVVVCAAWRDLEPRTRQAVETLEKRGWIKILGMNDALIPRIRSVISSKFLLLYPAEVMLMIDSDIVFSPEDAEELVRACRAGWDVLGAGYVVRGGSHLAIRIKPDTEVVFAPGAQPIEVEYVSTGFLAIHRRVFEEMAMKLPYVDAGLRHGYWPFFKDDIIITHPGWHENVSEDWGFVEKARRLGFKIGLHPGLNIGHIGEYVYHLEDLGRGQPYQRIIVNTEESARELLERGE